MKLPCLSACRAPLLGLFALTAPLVARAQQSTTVVRYTFSSLDGTAATVAPGASASLFTRDPADTTVYDNTAGSPAPDANSNGWSTGTLLDPSLFYTFTLTPGAGGASWNALSFDAARFDVQGIDDGPASFAVRSSLDGFTATLASGAISTAFLTVSVPLNVTTTNPVEYRVYGYNAGAAQGLFQIDNVALTYAVPEPGSLAAAFLAAGAAGLALRHCRRRSSNP